MTKVTLHQKINLRAYLLPIYTRSFGDATKAATFINNIFKG